MQQLSVLFALAMLTAIAVMSADGSGVRDQIDPELTTEVETLLEQSPLRAFAGGPPKAAPYSGGVPFVEFAHVEDGYRPLTDLDALYGVYGPPVVQVVETTPPADLVDDTPALIAGALANPPPDIK